MTCLGVLDRGERGDGNETDLKEGGRIKMSTTVLEILTRPYQRIAFDASSKK